MFDHLSEKFTHILKTIRGQGRLSEENIARALREVRIALLEADVALPVIKSFIESVKVRAIGTEVRSSLTPGQAMIKIVHEELIGLMGSDQAEIQLAAHPPMVILMAGLQGAGKTTTVAKLGLWLKKTQKKTIMVTSCDVYRPAAIEQLKTLAQVHQLGYTQAPETSDPLIIAQQALATAGRQLVDVLIIDTAGRLHIDEAMMQELQALHRLAKPIETLFVVDSMMGQDAVNAARAFDQALPITGVILTKTDGDARGGAALTLRQITGKPIKFMGTGEKITDFCAFHPDRVASNILGMGDILGLIETIEHRVDHSKARQLSQKLQQGKGFTLMDFREQLNQIDSMGGLNKLVGALPNLPPNMPQADQGAFKKMGVIIDSMTRRERLDPSLINGSRKKRIARGSGTEVQDVNRLLKQFRQMHKMMKRFSKKGGMQRLLRTARLPSNLRL